MWFDTFELVSLPLVCYVLWSPATPQTKTNIPSKCLICEQRKNAYCSVLIIGAGV